MRKIAYFILISFLVAVAISAEASSLKLTVQGKYSTQTTEVYREAKHWVCKTEHNPYTTAKTKPYSDAKLKSLAGNRSKPEGCRDFVIINDLASKPQKIYSGCDDDPEIKAFRQELYKNCRR